LSFNRDFVIVDGRLIDMSNKYYLLILLLIA